MPAFRSTFSPEFIMAIPKTDLHLHLDGSLRIETLIDLARQTGVPLPGATAQDLRATVFKDRYASLEEYLRGFSLTTAVMHSEDALYRVSYELMMDNAAEGVRYIEVRFAPQLLMSERMSFEQVMTAVDRGLRSAREELNAGLRPGEPEYDYGIIACAMRFFTADFSPYYNALSQNNVELTPTEVQQLASVELARDVVALRRNSTVQIVGFDLAGAEKGFPASDYAEAFALVGKGLLGKTVHAGEAYGAESIFQAVTKLHASRIGHGLYLFDEDQLQHPEITDRSAYVEGLVNFIAKRRITLEVCLSSNMQTTPAIRELRDHSLRRMLERGLSVTLCTDNRLVSNTTVCHEYQLAIEHFPIDAATLKDIAIRGFKRSFYYHSYQEKKAYLQRVVAYYDAVAKDFNIAA